MRNDTKMKLEECHKELARVCQEIGKIKDQLVFRLPAQEAAALLRRKTALGGEYQDIMNQIRVLKNERTHSLAEAFVTTTIRMFDPVDISEIWDRVYADYPELGRNV